MGERTSTWLRPLAFGIRWSPLAWLLGASELLTIAAVLVSSVALVRSPWTRLQWPALTMAAFLLTGVGALTWAIARGAPTERAVAALFNLAVWTLGFLVWLVVRSHDRVSDRRMLLRSVRDAGLWAGVAAGITLIAWSQGARGLSFATPLAAILPDGVSQQLPAILASAVAPIVYRLDWFFGIAVPRLQAFHPYPNALALTSSLAVVAHVALRGPQGTEAGRGRARHVAVLVLLGLPLVSTWSRTTLLAFGAVGFFALLLQVVPKGGRSLVAASVAWFAIVIVSAMLLSPSVATEVVSRVNDARAGSTATRFNLYAATLALAMERPWVGYGIKPRTEAMSIPIGSHSTLFGTALKSGVVGLSLLVTWLVVLSGRSLGAMLTGGRAERALAVGVLVIVAWSLIEDLDAPVVAAVQAFTIMGLLFHRHDRP